MFERLEEDKLFENRIYIEVKTSEDLTYILKQQKVSFTLEYIPFTEEVLESIKFQGIEVSFKDNQLYRLQAFHSKTTILLGRLGFDYLGNIIYDEESFNSANIGKLMED